MKSPVSELYELEVILLSEAITHVLSKESW